MISRPREVMASVIRFLGDDQNKFDDFFNDPESWVAIITGAGDRAFCAGNDLKYQAAGNDTTLPPSGFGGITGRFQTVKPVIAAVNGICMGGGFEIALACDLIVAAENAVFALPEPRVGLAAGAGGLLRLPRQIPLKQADQLPPAKIARAHVEQFEPRKLSWNHENHERHEHSDGYVNTSAHLAGESIITRSLSVNA